MFNDLLHRFRALFRRNHVEAELDEELRYHLEREVEKYIQSGMPREGATRLARLRFGGPEQIRQQCREERGTSLLEDALQDLHYGMRTLSSRPGFTIVVILTLALGIGSCTAIFSLMNSVLLPREPFGDASRLVYLYTPMPALSIWPREIPPSDADFFDLKQQSGSYAGVTYFQQMVYKLGSQQASASVGGARIDADFFPTLISRPELGRPISEEDCQPGHDSIALISHALWQQMFAGSSDVLGKTLQLNGRSYQIIGVMREGFHYPRNTDLDGGNSHITVTDLWVPMALTPQQRANRVLPENDVYALARLKPGISVRQAQAEMSTIMAHLDLLHQFPFRDWQAYVKPFRETLVSTARPLMWLLFGSVIFVLLIACGNAANLLLARGVGRTHELGMRAALGAGRNRLIRQMLTESLLLGLAGGLTGVVFAYGLLRLLLSLDPGDIPRLQDSSLDLRVLGFTFAVTLLTSVLTGILPALSSSRINLSEFLKSSSHRGTVGARTRLSSSLIIAEVALVVVLLSGAGLLLRSYANLEATSKGFSTSAVSMKLDIGAAYPQKSQRQTLFRNITERLNAIPGVQAAGIVDILPLSGHNNASTFWVQGYANQKGQMVETRRPTPGYFSAMNTPLIEGRTFTDDDSAGRTEVAIINEAFAKKYFTGLDPLGRWVRTDQPDSPSNKYIGGKTIVGVIADVRHSSLEEAPSPQLYLPLWQDDTSSGYIAIRSFLPTKDVASAANAVLHQIDPSLAFSDIRTMGELVSEASARRRFQTMLLSLFAAMALLLALVGLYGLVAYSVRQRTAEIGVRLALGASRADIVRLVLRRGLQLVAAGLVIGLTGALAFTRILTSFLYGVRATDPLTFTVVSILLLVAALAACLIPGWRAASIDPVCSLRSE